MLHMAYHPPLSSMSGLGGGIILAPLPPIGLRHWGRLVGSAISPIGGIF